MFGPHLTLSEPLINMLKCFRIPRRAGNPWRSAHRGETRWFTLWLKVLRVFCPEKEWGGGGKSRESALFKSTNREYNDFINHTYACCVARHLCQDEPEQRLHGGEADPGGPGHDLPVTQALQRHLGPRR